jgi:hypothetical protein
MQRITSLKNIKVGDKLTLVNRGICRSEYSSQTWIDIYTKGRASFFEVSKVGRKYLYGFYMWVEHEEEGLKRQYWEEKINVEDVVIHEGFNEELQGIYREYTKALREYEELRKRARSQIKRDVMKIESDRLNKWDEANPRPKTLNIEG